MIRLQRVINLQGLSAIITWGKYGTFNFVRAAEVESNVLPYRNVTQSGFRFFYAIVP